MNFSRFSGLKSKNVVFNEMTVCAYRDKGWLHAVGDFVAGALFDFDVDFSYIFADDAEAHEEHTGAKP